MPSISFQFIVRVSAILLAVLVSVTAQSKVIVSPGYQDQLNQEALSRTELAGDRYFEFGLYDEAIKAWRTPYHFYRQEQNLPGQVRSLYKIATAQRQLGLHDRAVQGLSVALRLLSLVDDPEMQLLVNANLAGAYLYSDDMGNAKRYLVEARNMAEKAGNNQVLALVLNDLGNFYLQTQQRDRALESFEESFALGKQISDNPLMMRAITNALLLMINQSDVEGSSEYLKRALNTVKKFDASYDKSFALVKLAEAGLQYYFAFNQADKPLLTDLVGLLSAEREFTQSLGNDWLTAQMFLVLSRYYEEAGRLENALTLANQALFHAQLIDASFLIYQLQWQAARIHRTLGESEKAIDSYQSAVSTLQPIRHQLLTSSWHSTSFNQYQGNVYLELADLMLQKASKLEKSTSLETLLKDTRSILESQKTAEVEDYFRDQCAIEARALKVDIDEAIDDQTAVIYPILLENRTELLVSTSRGINQYVVPEPEQVVTAQVRDLRLKLEKRRSMDYLVPAQALYNTLVAPIQPDLEKAGVTTLVFIPGQSLRTIPLTALHDGKQFLINRFAVATTPGLSLTDPRPLKRDELKVLLSGLSQPVQGFPPLEFVQNELTTIEDLYVSKILMDNSFLKTNVSAELENSAYGVAHFASHANFAGDVRDSYILTYDDRITVNQLGQFASAGQLRKKPIELLTLSACHTAAGDDRAALGLAGVAVQSGARSALASLWAINDRASSMLVAEFYRQLLDENVTKAQALQRAQQKMMQNVRYRHPGYWSPFLLIGNWL